MAGNLGRIMIARPARMVRQLVVLAVITVALVMAMPPARALTAPTIALIGADVLSDDFETIAPDQTIVITGNRITALGPDGTVKLPDGAKIIDLSGKTVIPGLWDAHIHSRYEGIDHLRLLIAQGITSTRDLGGPWEHLARILRWREEIGAGQRVGPRMWTPGTVIDNPGARWSHISFIETPEEGRAVVRQLKHEGADFVKVYSNLTPENFEAIMDEAQKQGLPVDGHVPRSITPAHGSEAGMRIIEHTADVALALVPGEWPLLPNGRIDWTAIADTGLSETKADALAALFKAHGTALDPTLLLRTHSIAVADGDEAVTANPALRFIPPAYIAQWAENARTPDIAQWQGNRAVEREAVAMLFRRGVPILAGTDTVKPYFVPGDALHGELAELVAAGLKPGDAIRAATLTPAKVMGVGDLGLIAPGFLADLLVLNSSPLDDIANTRDFAMVIANGRVFDRPALDEMIADIAASAKEWSGEPTGR